MSDGATTTKGKFRIGTGLVSLGVVALSVFGGAQLRGALDFTNKNGEGSVVKNNTGAVLSVDGFTHYFSHRIPLTMTGGQKNYNLALVFPRWFGISGSGVLTGISVEWVKAPAGGKFDVDFSKCKSGSSPNANTGSVTDTTAIQNLDNVISATGASLSYLTGALVFNGDDCLKVASLTNPTAAGSGYLMVQGYDTRAE